jgi:hypothetical protein
MSDVVAGPVVTPAVALGVGAAAGLDIVRVAAGVVTTCAGRSGGPVPVQALVNIKPTRAKADNKLIIRNFL